MSVISPDELPVEPFVDSEALYQWLGANHASAPGLWVQIARAKSGVPSIDWPGIVDAVLCWGWIDGKVRSVDEHWYIQRITPRRPRSLWSRINREKVERLIATGRMQAPGLVEVERAQADGRWAAAYDPPSAGVVPPELQAALDADAVASAAFAALSKSQRFSLVWKVQSAKRAETKQRHVERIVADLRLTAPAP